MEFFLKSRSIERLAINENFFFFGGGERNVGVDLTKHVREHLGAMGL